MNTLILAKDLLPCQRYKIKFKGKVYLFIGPDKTNGAIATKEQFENFDLSYAHLSKDGNIRRFGIIIGTSEDIKFLD